MDNTQLTLMITAALMVALLVGWLLHWLYALVTRPQAPQTPDETALIAAMDDAQSARAAAEARLTEVEAEMAKRLSQAEAELNATMDGLRTARMTNDSLEKELERLRAPSE